MDIVSGKFEWDSAKNEANSRKHGIVFEDVVAIFEEPFLRITSNRSSEIRWVALEKAHGRVIAAIYTERKGRICLISARRARKAEREIYHARVEATP